MATPMIPDLSGFTPEQLNQYLKDAKAKADREQASFDKSGFKDIVNANPAIKQWMDTFMGTVLTQLAKSGTYGGKEVAQVVQESYAELLGVKSPANVSSDNENESVKENQ